MSEMFCFPLTNWTTMRGGLTVPSIVQSEAQWLDLRGFEDIVTWLECRNVTPSGATNIQLTYQTAPTKDDSLFFGAATAINLAANTVIVTKVLMSAASIPLARWLRWQLAPNGGTLSASWDATFRIWIAANIGPHQLRPRIQAPPLRPNGKSCNGDCKSGGSAPISPRPNTSGGGVQMAGRPPASVGGRPPTTVMQQRSQLRGPSFNVP